jgi:hypothetical protein
MGGMHLLCKGVTETHPTLNGAAYWFRSEVGAMFRRIVPEARCFEALRFHKKPFGDEPSQSGYDFRSIAEFTTEADMFFDEWSRSFDVVVVRDAKYLNYKFVRQPQMNYQRFAICRGTELVGYLVMRLANRLAVISELIVKDHQPDHLRAAIRFAESTAYARGARGIEAISNFRPYQDAYLAFGFVPNEIMDCFMWFRFEEHIRYMSEKQEPIVFVSRSDGDCEEHLWGELFQPRQGTEARYSMPEMRS